MTVLNMALCNEMMSERGKKKQRAVIEFSSGENVAKFEGTYLK
jgi:hypothetical protein